jgi:hypothetical protein
MPASAQSDSSSLVSLPGSSAPSEEDPPEPDDPAAAAKLRDVEAEDESAGDEIVDGEAMAYEAPLSSPAQSGAFDSSDEQSPLPTTDRTGGVGTPQKPMPKPAHPQTDPAGRSSAGKTQQNPSKSLDDVKRDIVQSYRDCGLLPKMQFSAVSKPFEPTTITTQSNKIGNARLTPQSVEKLRAKRVKLLRQHWRMSPDSVENRSADEREIGLIRKLCNLATSHSEGPGVVSAMHKFCRQSNITQDETKLIEFWKWSVLIVAHHEDAHEEVGRYRCATLGDMVPLTIRSTKRRSMRSRRRKRRLRRRRKAGNGDMFAAKRTDSSFWAYAVACTSSSST